MEENKDISFVKQKNLFTDDIVVYKGQYYVVVRVAWDHDNLDIDDTDDTDDHMEDMHDESNENNKDKKKTTNYHTEKIKEMVSELKKELKEHGEELDENEDGDEDEEEDEDEDEYDEDYEGSDYNTYGSEYEYYSFTNNETGVLLAGISGANDLTELDYNECIQDITLFDRNFHFTDAVQKIGSNSQLLGSVIDKRKKYFVMPFEAIHTGLITQGDIVILDKVNATSNFIKGQKVMDEKRIAAGVIESVRYDLECLDSNNKIVKIKDATRANIIFHRIYSKDFTLCPGKLIYYKNKELTITKLIPTSANVEWLYFFNDEIQDLPNPTQPIHNIIPFRDDFEVFLSFEAVTYEDSEGNIKGGFLYLTSTKYLVAWQDGEIKYEDSTTLMICDPLATDYFPGDIVCHSSLDIEKPYSNENKLWGVILSYKPTERTVTVKWNNINHTKLRELGQYKEQSLENNENQEIYMNKEHSGKSTFVESDISVYDIEYFEDYNFDMSDYVCKVDDKLKLKEADVLGQVICKEDLKLIIMWNNGYEEMVYPFDLTKVDDFDESDDEEEEEEYESMDLSDEEKINQVGQNILKRLEKAKKAKDTLKDLLDKYEGKEDNADTQETPNEPSSTNTAIDTDTDADQEGSQYENGVLKFEMLKEFEAHNFFEEKCSPNKKFMVAFNKELEILRTSLPPGIFVKANSSRINLFSALIIGPEDTIYENSVFIFDIFLPSNYPSVAPKVFFHSVSFKLHPNLNVNGTVCLSLLGTWHGNRNEMWIPDVSNLLQVLISIQGLILGCKEPYFLEAGYETQIGTHIGVRNSSLYNEDSYLLSLETIYFYLKNQPILFKDIIINHFKQKKINILQRIDQFLNSENNNSNNNNNNNNNALFCISLPPSKGFISALRKLKSKIQDINLG
ncbi:hypothetical protein DICPUDRAFT_86508 [Dictyostelium purpureum]|uniref:UBC core domain-containing protein n=1 Tax=Dictyostelium purpureum TaxID=5786 RepID=F0ZC22_DICPU|nr:uncharacterized protein DICPUDRAFT_86508 [Dictyostelium purpureum]EGC38495.1 hypothetical protein DICPUDRAFT_86508 [Dictyostelium purpureum]|eukprot:XP_003284960.1 hypothetical protein DICPUDRAFT_86508 [Dictyostelium purpureum]